ncbi:MAG TPA: hypothetical protein VG223_04215 [Solirubrobacteraceae bacterium]|nr:hypothetical protein [Solirubrobacteraceae bacterium]
MGSDDPHGAEDTSRYAPAAEAARRARATAAAEAASRRRGEDTRDPRRPPPNATVYRPARRHAGLRFDDEERPPGRRRGWQRLLALGALAVVIAVGVVLIAVGNSATTHHRVRTPARTSALPTTTTAAAKPARPAAASWPRYATGAYAARVPPGWRVTENDVPISGGAYAETRFVQPGGATEIDIDRTPNDPAGPRAFAASVQRAVLGEPGYRQLSFAAARFDGAPAWQWEFSAPAGGRITLGGFHIDLFRHIAGASFAILGVGGAQAATSSLTRHVAASITSQ